MSDNVNCNVIAALAALNSACVKKTYQSFEKLERGEYIVDGFSIVDTARGKRVRIDMADTYMLLPERFFKQLSEETIAALNKAPKIMVYGGKETNNRNRLILEFRSDAYFAEMFTDYNEK